MDEVVVFIIDDLLGQADTHKTTIYSITKSISKPTVKNNKDNGYKELADILKNSLKFQTNEATEAAIYTIDKAPDKPQIEQIRIALQYLGNGTETNNKTKGGL